MYVYSAEEAKELQYDVVIVASFRHSNDIAKNAKNAGMKNIMVFTISEMGDVELENVKNRV